MNTRKRTELALVWALALVLFLTGCVSNLYGVAPIKDGEAYNLFEGTARWLTSGGDALVKTFINETTGVIVRARPLAGGWAIACRQGECPPVGYLVNCKTWADFKIWLTGAGGFAEEIARNVPAISSMPVPTIFVLPISIHKDSSGHVWESMPCLGPICAKSDAGQTYWPDEIDALFSDIDGTWTQISADE